MSSQLNQIKNILTCTTCQNLFNCPIILPCGDRICQEHLHEKSTITCSVCCEIHPITAVQKFPIDHLLTELQRLSLHEQVFIGYQHEKALEAFGKQKNAILELEKLTVDPYYYLYETVLKVRNEIDLKYELKLITRENYEQLLDELKRFEDERKNSLEVDKIDLNFMENFKR